MPSKNGSPKSSETHVPPESKSGPGAYDQLDKNDRKLVDDLLKLGIRSKQQIEYFLSEKNYKLSEEEVNTLLLRLDETLSYFDGGELGTTEDGKLKISSIDVSLDSGRDHLSNFFLALRQPAEDAKDTREQVKETVQGEADEKPIEAEVATEVRPKPLVSFGQSSDVTKGDPRLEGIGDDEGALKIFYQLNESEKRIADELLKHLTKEGVTAQRLIDDNVFDEMNYRIEELRDYIDIDQLIADIKANTDYHDRLKIIALFLLTIRPLLEFIEQIRGNRPIIEIILKFLTSGRAGDGD